MTDYDLEQAKDLIRELHHIDKCLLVAEEMSEEHISMPREMFIQLLNSYGYWMVVLAKELALRNPHLILSTLKKDVKEKIH